MERRCTLWGPWGALLGFMKRIFLPGELHGQSSLAGCIPWGGKESDPTEQQTHMIVIYIYIYIYVCIHTHTHISKQHSQGDSGQTSLELLPWDSLESWLCHPLVAQSCPTLCHPTDCSTPGFPDHHQLPELAQILVHLVGDAIQPSHPLLSPSPPAFSLSQHQNLFHWVNLMMMNSWLGFIASREFKSQLRWLIKFQHSLKNIYEIYYHYLCTYKQVKLTLTLLILDQKSKVILVGNFMFQ